MKRLSLLFFILIMLSATPLHAGTAIPEAPVKGKITMLDLGAHKCIPCKMMAPILKELRAEYKDRAAIVFIDVWENQSVAKKYGIRGIPTQIFYDASGKEISRHVGFMDKKSIVAELAKLGAEPPEL